MDIVMWLILLVVLSLVVVFVYVFVIKDVSEYKKAKAEIFPFIKSYKKRCTGNNRFIVTVETLQDSFREYETKTIHKVWLELIRERLIEVDPQDNEWCVR